MIGFINWNYGICYLEDSPLKFSNVMLLYNLQRALEREAAILGGGNLVAPAQTIPDFLDDKLSGSPCFLYNIFWYFCWIREGGTVNNHNPVIPNNLLCLIFQQMSCHRPVTDLVFELLLYTNCYLHTLLMP